MKRHIFAVFTVLISGCATNKVSLVDPPKTNKPVFIIDSSTPALFGGRAGYLPLQNAFDIKPALYFDQRLSGVLDPTTEARSVLIWDLSLTWVNPSEVEASKTLAVAGALGGAVGVLAAHSITSAISADSRTDFLECHLKAKYKEQWLEIHQTTSTCQTGKRYCLGEDFSASDPGKSAAGKEAVRNATEKCLSEAVAKIREIKGSSVQMAKSVP